MGEFADYQASIVPPFHDGPQGRAYYAAHGSLKDLLCDKARAAVYSRWVATCPDDALARHGRDLGFPKAPLETLAEYRTRLLKAWHLAIWRGTNKGIVDAFAFLGMTNLTVKEAFTPLWGRYPAQSQKRNVLLILEHPHPFGTTGGFVYGDGTLYGTTANGGSNRLYGVSGDPRWIPLIRQLALRQAPAHAHVEAIAVVLAGSVLNANLTTDGNPSPGSKVAYIPVSGV